MAPSPSPRAPFSAGVMLEQFEEAWQSGTVPVLEDFLPRAETSDNAAARRQLLEELIRIDLEYRWRRLIPQAFTAPAPRSKIFGDCPSLDDYVGAYPELGDIERLPAELVAWEYRMRHRWGDRPPHTAYLKRFPHMASALPAVLSRVDRELAAELSPGREAAVVAQPAPAPTPVAITSIADLVSRLHQGALLSPAQASELAGLASRHPEPRALGRELIGRGWLTPYQVNQLLQETGAELLLGPYLLLELLGEGGAGQVFKARHQKMNRVVALKLIRKELLADAEVLGRFYREIQVVSQLDHPNVVHAYDAGPAGLTHFLAMEYVEGTDLGKMVKNTGPLPLEQACAYIRQAALGLQHAHERGLVHRDIKPHNLILSLKEGLIKVTDLGLARLARPANEEATAVLTGGIKSTGTLTPENAVLIGTLDYLSPEQALEFHNADIRADIYSLGCTFYYLLMGRPPFAGGTLAEKLLKHQQAEPPTLEQIRQDVPAGVHTALRKMLAKKPEDRYQTPAEAAEALAVRSHSTRAGILDPIVRTPARLRLAKHLAALAAVAALAIGLACLFLRPRPVSGPSGGPTSSPAISRDLSSPFDRLQLGKVDPKDLRNVNAKVKELVVAVLRDGLGASSVAISPDATTIVSVGMRGDTKINLWDAATGRLRAQLNSRVEKLQLSFAPNGTLFSVNHILYQWDQNGRSAKITKDVSMVVFCRDGKVAATRGVNAKSNKVSFRKMPHLEQFGPVVNTNQPVNSMAFSPDGKKLVCASGSKGAKLQVELWEVASGQRLNNEEPDRRVWALAYAPDGRSVIMAGDEGYLALWDLGQRKIKPIQGPSLSSDPYYSLTLSPDGKRFITCDRSTVLLWNFDAAGQSARLANKWPWPNVVAAAFAPDCRHVALANGSAVYVIRLAREME